MRSFHRTVSAIAIAVAVGTAAWVGGASAQAVRGAPAEPPRVLTPEEEANMRANALGDPRELVSRLRGTKISDGMGVVLDAESLTSPLIVAVTTDRDNGETLTFMSLNGRYLVRGVVFDVWSGRLVNTMDELRAVNGRINFDMIGIKPSDLDPFILGAGPNVVRVFVDPMCPVCKRFFREVQADPRMLRDYTFELYLVPFLGESSIQAVRGLQCTDDREGALEILVSGNDRAALSLGAQFTPENCNPEIMLRRLIVSQQVGVTGVPYFIRHDHVPYAGLPPSLTVWLQGAAGG